MSTSKNVVVVLVIVVLALALYKYGPSKAKLAIPVLPSTATMIPERLVRSGLTTATTRDYPNTSGLDFANMADSVSADDHSKKDRVVGELLSVQDMLPDGTLGGIRHTDPSDTRQISVQLRNPYLRDSNPWVIQPVIQPVSSVHRMFADVNPEFHTPTTAYDAYDPERLNSGVIRT